MTRPDRRRVPAHRWVIGGLAVIAAGMLVVIAATGGFADRARSIPVVAPGHVIDTGEVQVTALRAWIATEGPGIRDPDPSRRWLVVGAKAVNTQDDPASAADLQLRAQAGSVALTDHPERTVRLAEDADLTELQPGLPTRVAWLWPITGRSPAVGSRIDLVLIARPRVIGDPLFGDSGHGDFEAIGRTRLEIERAP